ncbi:MULTISPECIES: dihydrofolate reductase [unclassified Lentilitoribacter]|jgi:dihydrofolate reductase|uniref:dihydrofolate reductase n=1 Tax=unclassified Lentilitoribacter TaxID=2647570 RepID=UPI0013A70C82|nr:dihydrofolate reductase [Lentilitoribacter sp. Alg239-R112]
MNNMTISMIAAVSKNGIIGRDGDMPWRLSTDLKRFKKVTMGCPIIIGRKTFQSFGGRPLPGRQNIVVSRSPFEAEGITNTHSLEDAIGIASSTAKKTNKNEIFIAGGGQIYELALEYSSRLYITHIDAKIDGDTKFPKIDSNIWKISHEEYIPTGEKDNYATRYVIYDRLET